MSRRRDIILGSIVALVALSYLIAAGTLLDDKQQTTTCKKVKITVKPLAGSNFVTDSTVRRWIGDSSITMIGTPVSELVLGKIISTLKAQPHVTDAQAFADINGTLTIAVTQRRALLRIKTDNGYDFYADSTLTIMPIQQHCQPTLPIVSGDIKFGFDKKYFGKLHPQENQKDIEYLNKIINFVEYIETNQFLRNLIVQIYITRRGDIELVPRIGTQIIDMGSIDEYPSKLAKLEKFYRTTFSQSWRETATRITLKFRDQVVVLCPMSNKEPSESNERSQTEISG